MYELRNVHIPTFNTQSSVSSMKKKKEEKYEKNTI